jgi:hypothetical protein
LDPYPGYTPVGTENSEDYEYEELPGGENICPERHANLFDSMLLYTSHSLLCFYRCISILIVRIATASFITFLHLLPI